MAIPHIEIKQDGVFTKVFVDGKELHGIRNICFRHSVDDMDSVPVLKIDLIACDVDIDTRIVPDLPEFFKPYYVAKEPPVDGSCDLTIS